MTKKIYLEIEGVGSEVIEILSKTTNGELRNLLFNAAECVDNPSLILKLYRPDGILIPITTEIEENNKECPYKLIVRQATIFPQNNLFSQGEKLSINPRLENKNLNFNYDNNNSNNIPPRSPIFEIPWPAKEKIDNLHTIFNENIKKPLFSKSVTEHLKDPTFDIWQWEEDGLVSLLEYMFIDLRLIENFNMDFQILDNFLRCCRSCYNKNPFHNFIHCFCVTQMMYGIINITGLVDILTPIEKLVLMISCIGHDLDHPGFNNNYQVNAHTDLALIYNDQSPLENHHTAVCFYILKKKETNILETLNRDDYKKVRKGIIDCILATDMDKHSLLVNQFLTITDSFSFDKEEHRNMLMLMLIKCADISNEVRPTSVSKPWVDNLLEELFRQRDKEVSEGLPSNLMDREKVNKYSTQAKFIAFVMIPLFEAIAKVLPNMDIAVIQPIRTALDYYQAQAA